MTADHAAWDELAAGYALNALEPEDEHAFADHLRHCDRCRRELDALREVAGHLAAGVEPAEPPADLGRRILDAAAAERPATFGSTPPPVRRERPDRHERHERHDRHERRDAREGADVRVLTPRLRRSGGLRVAMLATAASIVVVAALGLWNVSLRGDNAAQQAAIARRTEALSCLAAPETRKFPLTAIGGQAATACLAGGNAYVVADRLDRNDAPTSNYVLWWLDGAGAPHAVERFDVEATGTTVYRLPFRASPTQVDGMAVSLEPGSALPAQPTRVIVSGKGPSA